VGASQSPAPSPALAFLACCWRAVGFSAGGDGGRNRLSLRRNPHHVVLRQPAIAEQSRFSAPTRLLRYGGPGLGMTRGWVMARHDQLTNAALSRAAGPGFFSDIARSFQRSDT
jgi:hypothetical protein